MRLAIRNKLGNKRPFTTKRERNVYMPSRFYYKCNTVYIRGSFVYSMRRPSVRPSVRLSCHPPLLPSIHLNKEQRKRRSGSGIQRPAAILSGALDQLDGCCTAVYIALFSSTLIFPIFHSFFLFIIIKKENSRP